MRSHLLFVVGLFALSVQPQSAVPQLTPFPHSSDAVKLRLEIEIRGIVLVTEKSATITTKETVSEWVEVDITNPLHRGPQFRETVVQLQSHQVDKVWQLDLDDDLKKTAKALHGKEAVVIGKCLVGLGVETRAESAKTPAKIRFKTTQLPRGAGQTTFPEVGPEGIATSVMAQLRLDSTVTVLSLKAAK